MKIEATIKYYREEYRGIKYEIKYIQRKVDSWWTYYIIINLDKFKDNKKVQSLWLPRGNRERLYNYSHCELILKMEFHYGCTFYEKVSGLDGTPRIVKIGCDYNHYWDENVNYSVEDVEEDAKNSIDCFLREIE
jgi:hypothetical protein